MDDSWAMVTFPNGGRLSFVLKEQHPAHFCLETPVAGMVNSKNIEMVQEHLISKTLTEM